MNTVEIAGKRDYAKERDLVVPIVARDRDAYRIFAPRVSRSLSILLQAYRFREEIEANRKLISALEERAYPEYHVLTARNEYLLKQQETLHTDALDIAQSHKKRFFLWRHLTNRIHEFSVLQTDLDEDIGFAHVWFSPTDTPRVDILHTFALQALAKITWDAYTVPESVRSEWRLLNGVRSWQGNLNVVTVFDLRDASERLREEFRWRYPHGYKAKSMY